MKLIIALMLCSSVGFAAKSQKSLTVVIQCERVSVGATNAIDASMSIGTTDDARMVKSIILQSHVLTAGQATALTNLCGLIQTTLRTQEGF